MSEYIGLPISLGLIVNKMLEKKYGVKRTPKSRNSKVLFTSEELESITELTIKNPHERDLEGVDLLPNLKTINVETNAITTLVQNKEIRSISDDDISSIEKCSKLKNLSIVNQAKISHLDVTDLKELQFLTITHNQNLKEIKGINELNKLGQLSCFGNNRLFSIPLLHQELLNNEKLVKLNLDVLLFPNAINYANGEYDTRIIKKLSDGYCDVTWSESLNGNSSVSITNPQMIRLHNKSCAIISNNIPENASEKDIIIGIENYLSQNVKYDYEGMEKHTHTSGSLVRGPINGTNCAYNAIIFNTCVCEGYTRAMQYLLKLKNIKSHNVDCFGREDTIGMADGKDETIYTRYKKPDYSEYHSIICIDDYYSLYDDPCWNACMYQNGDKSMQWILKTKEEISHDHTLSFGERGVENNDHAQNSKSIQHSLHRINLFKNTRPSSINNTRASIAKDVKGQIIIEKEGNEL